MRQSTRAATATAVQLAQEVDHRRRSATVELDQDARGERGQFLTPSDIARLMASMFGELPKDLRLLDAGAGVGGLTAAFVAEACSRADRPHQVMATAFELDEVLVPHLRETIHACKRVCAEHGVEFVGRVRNEDFLEAAADALGASLFRRKAPLEFDAAILNPPYRKIGTDSRERRLVQAAGLDATNLYAAFVALSIRMLVPGGQVVAIIPRSFCNGPYFRPFRDVLLTETSIARIHVFDSRKDAFKDDQVLQENVIVHAVKSRRQARRITLSSSRAGSAGISSRRVDYGDIVREAHSDRFIHLPTNESDEAVSRWMMSLPETLQSLGLMVSTGRVVDFRARGHLQQEPEHECAPLIYPCHFLDGQVRWPKIGSRKPNAIAANAATADLLIPGGYYVVTKRFSSKEERRRLVAAVFDPALVHSSVVGFENHLNYFHRAGRGLAKDEAYGLAAFLNSEPLDRYFRQFNGHTQVNANDLRSLRYPSAAVLRDLGGRQLRPGSSELEEAVLAMYPICRATRTSQP